MIAQTNHCKLSVTSSFNHHATLIRIAFTEPPCTCITLKCFDLLVLLGKMAICANFRNKACYGASEFARLKERDMSPIEFKPGGLVA